MSSKEVFKMARKRRTFTDEYKAEVANLIAELGFETFLAPPP